MSGDMHFLSKTSVHRLLRETISTAAAISTIPPLTARPVCGLLSSEEELPVFFPDVVPEEADFPADEELPELLPLVPELLPVPEPLLELLSEDERVLPLLLLSEESSD